ncbi:MAG: protein-(glutamine-N5) methyltransferase, release factor-specific [Gemmatimonadetes bacterium]|nr:protein-(glutamine-N5) methyltransferase, release factor-specific [Gemmatimonadota bacterium]
MADAPALATEPRTLGALAEAMAVVLAPSAGNEAGQEARELLAALHDMPRHWVAVERGSAVSTADWSRGLVAAARRAKGAPVQYAAGQACFRHLTLDVDERVLIPRPETEQLVDVLLGAVGDARGGVAVDVGTGSGAIALSLASEGPFARVIGTDISRDALAVAQANALRCAAVLHAPVEWRAGSLLRPVHERPLRAVVSNPPYISPAEADVLPAGVRDWEPAVALFSGSEGMAATAQLVREAADALGAGGVLALEVDSRRASITAECVASHGAYEMVQVLLDLTGRERFVVARRREAFE